MIYGLNFSGTPIPEGYARKFRKTIKLEGMERGQCARLQGVGESEYEAKEMVHQADNGRRQIHVERRRTAGATLFGVYVY